MLWDAQMTLVTKTMPLCSCPSLKARLCLAGFFKALRAAIFGYSWFIIILSMFISWEPRAESGRIYTYIIIHIHIYTYIYIIYLLGPWAILPTKHPVICDIAWESFEFFFVKMFCKISALRTPCQEELQETAMMFVKQCRARAT